MCIHARVLAAALWGEMSTASVSTSTLTAAATTSGLRWRTRRSIKPIFITSKNLSHNHHHPFLLRGILVLNFNILVGFISKVDDECCKLDYLFLVLFAVTNDSSLSNPASSAERSEADKLVDGLDFGELCNEFECISSPLVESTARQLVRDILELREGNRALGTYAVSVQYKVFIFYEFDFQL